MLIKDLSDKEFKILNLKNFKEKIGSLFSKTFLSKINDTFFFYKNVETKDILCSVIVNESIDLETLLHVKHFINQSKFLRISLRSIDSFNAFENSYLSNIQNKINDLNKPSNLCFLFSSNPKIECTLLNIKLRAKYVDQNHRIFGFGLKSNNNLPINFVNLKLSEIFRFLEGKHKKLSKIFAFSKISPIFLFGESFNKRSFINNRKTFCLIRSLFSFSLCINVDLKANTSGIRYLNVRSLSKKFIDNTKLFFCFNLFDNNLTRSILKLEKTKFFWFNTHGSNLALRASLIGSTFSPYETEALFMNMEERVQQTSHLSVSSNDSSIQFYEQLIFFKDKKYKEFKSITSILEIIKNQKLFNNLNFRFIRSFNYSFSNNDIYLKYPLKSSIEDFYNSMNNYSRNSEVLVKCASYTRGMLRGGAF